MHLVRFNTKTYCFQAKEDALGFARTWNLKVEERANEHVQHAIAQYSHALDTIANISSQSAIVDLIKTYDLEWRLPFQP